ncbi:MAG TPA: hypothetical protein VK254_03015, partial [Candidatus Bathyarchaeia archaeon]|nr:hypothetical protein [Candidatus Bathyarchaeia archaeon]
MKINKQTTRKIGKGLNLFVALLMILQPVGTPGLLGAIAFADDSTVQSADVQAPAPETKADSTPAEDASSTVDSSATTDAGNKASDAKSESAVNPTIETPKDAGIVPAETPATTTTETPAATGESSDPAVVQSASDAVQTNSASTQADSDTSNSSTDNSNPTISPDAAGTTIAPKDTFSTAKQEERGNLETVVVNNVKAKSLDLKKIDPENVEQTAKLATDKADYAPTGTAIITGTGFIAGETYTLIISSNDEPPVSKTVQVTADKTGQFVYAYQLDGNYRPDYKVESKDSTGDVIASVTFTDSVIPSNKVGISMTGFVLSGAYSLPGGQPTGKGQLKNGNVGAYPEGACIPVEMKIENNDNSTGDTIVSPVFDYFDTVVGIDHLEKITTNITGDPSSSADNLNDFSYPGSDLKAVTSFSNSTGGNTAATISGPYAGGTAGTSSVTATNAQRHYNITLSSIAPGVTVYLTFCGRLDLDASQYNGGSAMSIRSAQGGNENVPIPVNQILQLPSLTLAKIVQGGSATPDQWSFDTTTSINGQSHFSIPSGQNLVTIPNVSPDGDFSITESGPDGYSFSSGTGANCTFNGSIATATVAAGNPPKNASCTFTNIVQESHLTLVKTVTNNNGGSAATTDWTLSASGPTSISGATGSGAVTNAIVSAGAYTLSESGGPSGYTASNYSCVKNNDSAVDGNSITLAPGDNATCTITNDDQPGTLIVKKVVVNNNGGTKQAQDFSFSVDGGASQAFESDGQNDLTVDADTYDVTEPAVDGYTTTYNNCTNVVVPNGGTATCTITNNDQAATLTVIKHVVNDNGGTKTAGAFTMNVTGSNVSDSSFAGAEDPGTTVTLNAGAYSVDEDAVFGYAKTIGADCSGTIANGDHKTCTITNDDIQPKL